MQTSIDFPTYVFATVNPGRATKVVEELKRINHARILDLTGKGFVLTRVKRGSDAC